MQKLPIVFLLTSLVLCMSSAAPAYQALDPTEASSDTQIQSLIQFGLDQIVQNGVGKGFFDDGTVFTLSQLNSVAEEIGNGTSYQFDCNFVEASGMKLFAKFTVRVNNASGNNSLASFSYRVTYPPVAVIPGNNTNTTAPAQNNTGEGETTTPPTENNTTVPVTGGETTVTSSSGSDANEFTPITKEEFNQSEALNAIFQFGFAEVVTQGISDNKIPNTLFTHAVINELAYKPTKGGNVYKFSTRASDQKGSDLNMTFEVVQRVSAYKYNVRTVIVSPPTNQTENNTTEPTNPTTPPVNNNNTNPETPTTPPTNNTEIDEDTQGALSFAINRIMQIGNGNGKIPVGTYSTEVTASSMTGSATSTVYDFSVKLTEAQNKANVTANFTVTVKANGNKILSKYSFRVSYPSKPVTPTTPTTPPVNNTTPEAPTVPPTNTTQPETPVTNTTEPETPVPEPPVTNTTEPETPVPEPPVTEPETPVTNTTEPETPVPEPPVVNTTEPEAPVTNTTEPETPATNTTIPPATNSTSTDYITVDPSEVASNQVIQEVINYGIDQVTQIGIKQGKIPNATYTLKTTGAVSKKDSANGTSYKFTVTMENAAKNVLNISATVMNNVKKGTKAVTGFSYNVKNIKA